MTFPLIQASALSMPLRDESVDCIVTSPPYFGLRRYGDSGNEVGIGALSTYLWELEYLAKEMLRVLKVHGTAWVNIGDTASGSGGAGGDWKAGARGEKTKWKQGDSGIPKGQWCLVPQRAAIIFQDAGFYVRSVITWNKGRTRPEAISHVKRPLVQSEQLFMLTKVRTGYKYHADFHETLVDKGDIWNVTPGRSPGHGATFPENLVARALGLSTDAGDLVLDPFAGSGTVADMADLFDRRSVSLDLYPDYFEVS